MHMNRRISSLIHTRYTQPFAPRHPRARPHSAPEARCAALTAELAELRDAHSRLEAENKKLRTDIAALQRGEDVGEDGNDGDGEDDVEDEDAARNDRRARKATTQRARRAKKQKQQHQKELEDLTSRHETQREADRSAAPTAEELNAEEQKVLKLYRAFQALYDRKHFSSELAPPWELVLNLLKCLVHGPLPPQHIFMKWLLFALRNALTSNRENFRWAHYNLSDKPDVRNLQTGPELKNLVTLASIARSGKLALNFLRGSGAGDDDGSAVTVEH
jgi:hypothetical protein